MYTITIQQSPLLNIIRSAYAVYAKETYGNLYGHLEETPFNTYYIVESAIPLQTIERTYDCVYENAKEEKRLSILPNLEQLIGNFHSHPNYRCSLGKFDRKTIVSKPSIYLIISITRSKRSRPFTSTTLGIHGDLKESDIHIGLRGYACKNGKIKVARLKIKKNILKNIFRI